MEKTSYHPGTPSWVDLGAPDVDAAARFYGELFGWQTETGPDEAEGYRMATLNGHPVAGIGPAQSPGTPFWSVYVSVADAEETRDLVLKAGGTVLVEPAETSGFGRFAVFADPTGAQISVWQPLQFAGSGLLNEPGTMYWHELTTRDADSAVAFYRNVFGWQADRSDRYVMFRQGDTPVAGLLPMDSSFGEDAGPQWVVYFQVGDADAAVAKVGELGGSVAMPATDVPQGRFAIVNDPDGAVFAILAPPAEGE
jgi:predicted enzyme related to lactoylglutathione lyase